MRFLIEATEDLQKSYGDRTFNLKAGEQTEVSGQGYEIVMSEKFGGGFKLVKEVPETDAEKERAEAAEAKEKLMGAKKDKLVRQAEKLDITNAADLNKEPLADAIIAAKTKGDK